MKKVRVGVIGIGWFGEMHIFAYKGVPNVEVAALCTRTKSRLEEMAAKYDVKKTYTDYHDLLNDPEIDAVSICTHAPDHLEPMLAAIKSGKHILLEKPMALTVAECDKMIEAAKDAKQNIMVGHICRFENNYAMARQEVLEGRIGEVLSIYARRNINGDRAVSHLHKLSSVTGDSVHDIDLMNWIVGKPVTKVYTMAVNSRDLPNYDVGWVNLHYGENTLGVSESIWNLPSKTPYAIDARMEIIGTEGAIYVNEAASPLVIDDKNGRSIGETVYWPTVHGNITGALHNELAYFVDCIIKGRKPDIITLEESRYVIEVINAAERSAQTGQIVTL
ncbi:MAG: Gfo/Idh/MocA family protein [Caldicoprobacterales bacterium]|jgi:UDP-N-acetylglucosamine 3-dehydrogenase|nr:Gfo/Idh/MocA family oxidoreductase [Clostridiales bacterium]